MSDDYAHPASRNNPLLGRRHRRGVAFDEKSMQPRYCYCNNCGNRTLAKVDVECGSIPCIKCGEPMIDQ